MPENRKYNGPDAGKKGKDSSPIEGCYKNVKPEYVDYVLRIVIAPRARALKMVEETVIAKEDRSRFPVVVTDGYYPKTAVGVAITVTIKGMLYTCPEDFDYEYSFHSERNEVKGDGFELIKETLHFKNLPGHPTLSGLAEEKSSGVIYYPKTNLSHAENVGNYQVIGTGIFEKVKGSGIAMYGRSTRGVVYHIALIEGWPL